MFLSKVMIGGVACRNPYEIHRVLWSLFPENVDVERDFLFRIEHSGQQSTEVLLQSLREPVNTVSRDARVLAVKPYPLALHSGQRLQFLLLANPVKTINDANGRLNAEGEVKKCRVPLIREEELHTWLLRKLAGFAEVEKTIIEKRPALNFRKASDNLVGKIQPVSFQGVLKVTDPVGLKGLIVSGIGPAKGFGCGLMLVKRG